jgi:DUF1009 family protein
VTGTTTAAARESAVNMMLGLVAGEGKLPAILAQSARDKGYKVVALALSKDAYTSVSPHADNVYEISPGQLGKGLKIVKDANVKQAVFVGKVPKINLLLDIFKLDMTAVTELRKLPNFNDDTIQRGVGDLLERNGIKVLTQSEFLRHLFPGLGSLTKREPTIAEFADVEFGLTVAREIARLDIGQTVIVKDRMILAVEAIEGTDEAIKRAVQLARGPVVVVKLAKKGQDQRFDIPTVGMNTMQSMTGKHPGGVLAIADTMMVEREEMIKYADKNGIAIVSVGQLDGL